MNIDFAKFFTVGGSFYAILPAGTQKIYSRVTSQSGSLATTGKKQVFNSATTTGPSSIASDHGLSASFDVSPNSVLDFEAGYTHSFAYELNTMSFGVSINIGQLMKRSTRQ